MGYVKVYADYVGTGALVEPVDAEGNPVGDGLYMHGHDITSVVWHVTGGACDCGESDGTVDCECGTALEFYEDAVQWLDMNDGTIHEDPGYFS
jgi:hypothetical protein